MASNPRASTKGRGTAVRQALCAIEETAQNGATARLGSRAPFSLDGPRRALCAIEETAQNGATARLGSGAPFGLDGPRRALCAIEETAQNGATARLGSRAPFALDGPRRALCSIDKTAQNGATARLGSGAPFSLDGPRRALCAVEAALAGAALLFFRLWPAPATPAFRACPFYWLTALPCPLCGLTRGLAAAAKGEWAQAMEFHALSPGFLIILLIWLAVSIGRIGGIDLWPSRWTRWREGAAVVLAYGVLRVAERTL